VKRPQFAFVKVAVPGTNSLFNGWRLIMANAAVTSRHGESAALQVRTYRLDAASPSTWEVRCGEAPIGEITTCGDGTILRLTIGETSFCGRFRFREEAFQTAIVIAEWLGAHAGRDGGAGAGPGLQPPLRERDQHDLAALH
jgi:hypothetical protein